jgi:hypothetical protein
MAQGLRATDFQTLGEIRDKEPDEEVRQGRILLRVSESFYHEIPKWPGKPMFLYLIPSPYTGNEHILGLFRGKLREKRHENAKYGWLFGFCKDPDHLQVEILHGISRLDPFLHAFHSVLACKKGLVCANVFPQRMIRKAKFVEDYRCPVGPEYTTVKPYVEKPIVFQRGLVKGSVQEVFALYVFQLQDYLQFHTTNAIKANGSDAVDLEFVDSVFEFPLSIVPKDDALLFSIVDTLKGSSYLRVHHGKAFVISSLLLCNAILR